MTEGREHDCSASTTGRPPPRRAQDDDRADPPVPGYAIGLTLRLPRDRVSVPVARHLATHTLREVGASADDIADVELALTEACTNVLDHAGPGDAYDVSVTVRSDRCELRIVDGGHGFAHDRSALGEPPAERGRGLGLMRALMDAVDIHSEPDGGTRVALVKSITFDQASPACTLLAEALQAHRPHQG